ncbi:MAG: sugar phosphate isomerase/epimerase [Armatimonadetes bacterium]|nr:sugar phosphate isomerase/epimerase [Armatimonadota bacterium]
MKISFMTWACPDWDLNQVLTAAVRYGYDGVEPRVEADQKHGIDLDRTKKEREDIKRQFADMGVEISCLATSRRYALADREEWRESVELTQKYVDLAADLGCPNLRVFGGPTPEGMSREDAQKLVAEALAELGPYAAQRGVWLALETHDDYSLADWCAATLQAAGVEGVGICWDIMHPFRHGQSIEEAFAAVKDLVRHCHVHDGHRPADGGPGGWELAKMGEGDIPHDEAVKLLAGINFEGHLSGEYINFLPADELLPHEAKVLREYLRAAGQ